MTESPISQYGSDENGKVSYTMLIRRMTAILKAGVVKMKNEKLDKLFSSMARPSVRSIEAYKASEPPAKFVRLMANENNLGVSPKALEAMKTVLEDGNRYPESSCKMLREKLAARYGLKAEQILIGNGLDGVFTMFSRAFMEKGDEVVSGELTFSIYADNAQIMGATPVPVPMKDDLSFDVDGFIRAVTEHTKMVFFCNPNNPTGTMAAQADIVRMLDAMPAKTLFVLDEAYMDFADKPESYSFGLLAKYPNLVVARTFSKIYGLAGLRVGWVAAAPELLSYMNRVREPYGVTEISAAGAAAALDDTEFYAKSREVFLSERRSLCSFLDQLGVKYIPSQGNFVLLPLGARAERVNKALTDAGLIVRNISFRGKQYMRITLGLPVEDEQIKAALSKAFLD